MNKKKYELDHVDIVTTHMCNNNCPFCIDKFINTNKEIISLETIEKFLKKLKKYTDKKLTVLLLGGEPTTLPFDTLIDISNLVHKYNYRLTMSTNGKLKNKILKLIPYFDSIQVTVNSDEEIDFYRDYPDKINIKIAGDKNLTLDKFYHFIEYTKGFDRRSLSMYFDTNFNEICEDKDIWNLLNKLEWKEIGSYLYTFYKGVRIKRCIAEKTNIVDEPTIPKLYPNGNYNKTWNNEDMDDYLV